jgi:hypothetical protein
MYAVAKNPTITEPNKLTQIAEENRIPERVLCTNSETTELKGRPRSRWQNEVRED